MRDEGKSEKTRRRVPERFERVMHARTHTHTISMYDTHQKTTGQIVFSETETSTQTQRKHDGRVIYVDPKPTEATQLNISFDLGCPTTHTSLVAVMITHHSN